MISQLRCIQKKSYYHLWTNWFHFIVKIIYPFFQKFNFQMKYCRNWFNQIKLQFAIHHFFVENTNFPSKQTNIITIYCTNVIKSFKKRHWWLEWLNSDETDIMWIAGRRIKWAVAGCHSEYDSWVLAVDVPGWLSRRATPSTLTHGGHSDVTYKSVQIL